MSERFDDLAMSLASDASVGRRSMIRSALAAVGLGAGAVVTGARPAAAAPREKPVSCPPGLTACGGLCRDLTSSHANCGACGNACASNAVCSNGTCVAVDCTCVPTCPSGLTWCGACVNTETDELNCGACGAVCAPGQVCSNGVCAQCVDDAGCPSGSVCTNGVCVNPCPGVNLMTDPQNCGSCGTVCPSVNSTPICTNGTCGHGTCNAGFADCNPNQPGCETNITNDNANCGGCGIVCGAGATCVSGTCTTTCVPQTCASLGKNCGMQDDGCGGTIDCGRCPSGMTCFDGVCGAVPP